MNNRRLFYTVYSDETERELFTTRSEAMKYFDELYTDKDDNHIYMDICEVENWYEENGLYNYTDNLDTFTSIITLTTGTHN